MANQAPQAALSAREIDSYVGTRVRALRQMAGLSQQRLAEALGLTFQQVQKYERGSNRISASKLLQIAQVLQAPVGVFFDGLEDNRHLDAARGGGAWNALADQLLSEPAGVDLARAFARIPSAKVRRRLADLATVIADGGPAAPSCDNAPTDEPGS
ncbi:helix-turn-helix domain-containing protein [Phenylobacterium conjunctum]|uniref:Helix-turn-helix domain-containing protein n=1 Tax=Phenylobacterium conjunctum TaxID=1298959 RepID=A0ABW3T4B7_9CAUL